MLRILHAVTALVTALRLYIPIKPLAAVTSGSCYHGHCSAHIQLPDVTAALSNRF